MALADHAHWYSSFKFQILLKMCILSNSRVLRPFWCYFDLEKFVFNSAPASCSGHAERPPRKFHCKSPTSVSKLNFWSPQRKGEFFVFLMCFCCFFEVSIAYSTSKFFFITSKKISPKFFWDFKIFFWLSPNYNNFTASMKNITILGAIFLFLSKK